MTKRTQRLDPHTLRWVADWFVRNRDLRIETDLRKAVAAELRKFAKEEEDQIPLTAWRAPTAKEIAQFEKIRRRALKLTERAKIAEAKS